MLVIPPHSREAMVYGSGLEIPESETDLFSFIRGLAMESDCEQNI